jgi:hypothetical protein
MLKHVGNRRKGAFAFLGRTGMSAGKTERPIFAAPHGLSPGERAL